MDTFEVGRRRHGGGRYRRASGRRGASMVELALVLPLFLMLVLGVMEAGRLIMVCQMVTESSRVGCRLATLSGATATEVTNGVKQFLQASAGLPSSAVTVTITGQTQAGGPINQSIDLATIPEGYAVCVKVEVTYAAAAWIPPRLIRAQKTSGSTVMRKESR